MSGSNSTKAHAERLESAKLSAISLAIREIKEADEGTGQNSLDNPIPSVEVKETSFINTRGQPLTKTNC